MQKLLSICIPTYNRYPFVSKLVKHLLSFDNALFKDVDLVIADNCSSDETQSFFQVLHNDTLDHLKYYRNEKNIGATKNLEKLINLAVSKYVWWFGDDDWMEEENLVKALNLLKAKNLGLLLLDRCVIFETGKEVNSLFSYYTDRSMELDTHQLLSYIGPLTALGCISNTIFNKNSLTQVENFDVFCDFNTSHPQVGYLLANLSGQYCYMDIENKITTYAFRQTPEEYEFNNQNDEALHKDLVSMLAVGLPRMYTFLIEKAYIKRLNLLLGKEMIWGYGSLLSTGTHADFLLSITQIRKKLDFIERKEMKEKIYWLYKKYFCFFKLLGAPSTFYHFFTVKRVKGKVVFKKMFGLILYLELFNFIFFKIFYFYDILTQGFLRKLRKNITPCTSFKLIN